MRRLAVGMTFLTVLGGAVPAFGVGAQLHKSGPIQVTEDGRFVWVANTDNDSVSRIDTRAGNAVLEVPLPDPGTAHGPRGLSVMLDGSEVWVACHDSDRVYVLDGTDGSEIARIDLPWGTGPYSVVLGPRFGFAGRQEYALVTGYRGSRLVALDVPSRGVTKVLEPVYISPFGAAFVDDGSAWVTHLFADGEHPRRSRVDFSDPSDPKVTTKLRITAVHPQDSTASAPYPAEGGYLTTRGHPAQVPAGRDPGSSSTGRLWVPFQYENIHERAYSPDSTIQSTMRKLSVDTKVFAEGSNFQTNPEHPAKVILTAVEVHDPPTADRNPPRHDGPGWNAQVSGPVDLGFSADGLVAYVLHEQSEDLLVMPTDTEPIRPSGAPPLVEIPVGRRPMGLVLSPTSELAYVSNALSRTVSVVDLATLTELEQVPVAPVTGEPLAPSLLRGAQLFFTSNDDRISLNRKVSCASCHVNGEHDGRGWDLQSLPGNHGPRPTQTLLGVGRAYGPVDPATGFGQLHRSGDRDEIQDFEHTLQGPQMGGTGFLGAAVNPELGAPNAGLDPDLDALAEFVLSLEPPPHSPHRLAGGALSPSAVRGATFFMGADPAKPADAACAACHVPETAFTDLAFHDVGQRVAAGENELNNRSPANHVNTPSLLGAWMTPPYVGVATYAADMLGALLDFRVRTGGAAPHGRVTGLTNVQLRDLAEFVLSLDAGTTAAEVRGAVDLDPPRIVRVSPTSPTRLEVWFDESLERSSAESVAAWDVRHVATGRRVPVVAAVLDTVNGDRVTLTLDRLEIGCRPETHALRVIGPVIDLADTATGGSANALLDSPPALFDIGTDFTITLGSSGYENLTIPVHDAATLPPRWSTWSHGSAWLVPNGNDPTTAFVRFEWSDAFRAATGVTDSADILDARFTLHPDFGDAQTVEARRVLKEWHDHRRGDWTSNPTDPATGRGGPTWTESERNARPWTTDNARAITPGVEGDDPADYFGTSDTSFTPEATVVMPAINEPLVVADAQPGDRITDAYRFFFDYPSRDYGHCLRLLPGASLDARFEPSEAPLTVSGPSLTITYRVPRAAELPRETSAPASGSPLLVAQDTGGLRLAFEDLGPEAVTYSVYEGTVGAYYSHRDRSCGLSPSLGGGRAELVHPAQSGDRYFLVTATGSCGEGIAGTDWTGAQRDPALLGCPP